jgi:cell pole-organizing protein PopZ
MIDPKTQQEPSMEEILASIRKIISDEDTEEAEVGGDEVKEAEAHPESAAQPETAADDILDLTEVVGGEETAEPEGEAAPTAPEPTAPEPIADEPIAAPEEDGGEAPAAEPALENGTQASATELEPGDESGAESDQPAAAEGAIESEKSGEGEVTGAGGSDDGYLSEKAASASTATLKELAQALNQRTETADRVALGSPNLTLEEIVRDLLRPMLREWLDENLHTLVERAVRREIERMVRKAEDLSENT